MIKKPQLSFWQIWNMSFGFLGIQFGFALQNANASSILLTFGADIHQLSWFWLVAPITGMIVQPIIGYFSDKTWNRLGRRRPYFLAGAIFTSTALILMPNAPHLATMIAPMFIGGGMLMIMDASMNISMEPFRALVADKLPEEQHSLGFSMQTLLIGIGAVIGSWLPYILGNWFGVSKVAVDGFIPDNVTYSFYFGAFVLISSIIWTVTSTNEYPPEFYDKDTDDQIDEKSKFTIPRKMWQLLLVQFFSWFALFSMWVYTTPTVAEYFFGASNPDSPEFKEASNWVGILFGIYNGVSAIIALSLPKIALRIGRKRTHAIALLIGGVSFLSFGLIPSYQLLVIPMIGIGIAWGSILAMPYAMLANSLPAKKMGVFMGLFNMSITIPQIVNGVFGGLILKYLFNGDPMLSIYMAGVFMIFGALSTLAVNDKL
ncbi:MAG: MFS transporter [Bacteroidales bacterium]|jgi:maltose/moltooligosaccharide transporter|nr:MFS transporter [Lentimicrobiaceae bacterium]MDG1135288.1 MFS transporter [Bacteroidales bacterium]MDG1901554.1 MFS transporter [Bacteroidales bacterium]MDG2081603.1 MFS transporter [Bacteroidales bacterium]